ncbi:MAG TPA: hypothetical protein PK821_01215 [Victivallales bacterium]|nr:hypothetical protein [Victivallales bacterium]
MRIFVLTIVFFVFLDLGAEVFLLGPGSDGAISPSSAINPTDLWTEPVLINGARASLKISLQKASLAESLNILKSLYPNSKFASNSESVLFDISEGKTKRRIYLVECGKDPYPVMQFYMEFNELPKNFIWPASLPIAPDSTPIHTMEFPDRKSIYGKFKTSFPAKENLSSINSFLLTEGWTAITREAAKAQLGSSDNEFYIRHNPTEIMSVSVQELDDGGSVASVYRKKLEN